MQNLTQADLSSEEQNLIEEATKAMEHAHVPYSNFAVGAAVRTSDGMIFRGCNIENASYGLTVCAERTAIFKAVSDGYDHFTDIAIVIDLDEGIGSPCGACRQVMNEFNAAINVIMATTSGNVKKASLEQLLPDSFGANYLDGQKGDQQSNNHVDPETVSDQ